MRFHGQKARKSLMPTFPCSWGLQKAASKKAASKRIPDLDTDTIRSLIEQGLPGARAMVQGEDGVHFEALVVAEAFRGKLTPDEHAPDEHGSA